MEEITLKGGRSTKGVVRLGNTVRRPHKKESDFSNAFLVYLESCGFAYSQRYAGRDEQDRDIFLFIDGYVPDDIGRTTLAQLLSFMRIVRQFHDLSKDFTGGSNVVCHNDLSPCNTVFVDGSPAGIIDWDGACIGERWHDLTYILWLWINIGSHHRDSIDIIGQMKAALASYGADAGTCLAFSDKLAWRMDKVLHDMSPNNYQYERTKDWIDFSKLWVEENRNVITQEIG